MSGMNERIKQEQARLTRERAEAKAQREERSARLDEDYKKRGSQFVRVAEGLGVLAKLLAGSDAPPEGWAKYHKGRKYSGGTYQNSGLPFSDGRAEIRVRSEPPNPLLRRLRDPYWYLGAWDTDSGVDGVHNVVKDGGHNFITASGKVIEPEAWHQFINLKSVTGQLWAARLVILSPEPYKIAEQVIWTAAHYNLEWPAGAPDLTDL